MILFYHARFPQTDSILIGFGTAILVLVLGAWYFNKKARRVYFIYLMNKETVIKVTNATVRFNKATEQYNGLKEYVIKMLKGGTYVPRVFSIKRC